MNKYWKMALDRIQGYRERSRFFSRNTTPKIISIIFALVMWLYVMGDVNPEVIEEWKNVKVQLLNVEEMRQEGLVVIGETDFTVNVKVKGKRNELYKVSSNDMVIRADLRGFRQGINSVPLEYSAPTSINVEDINPKEIKITLDEIVTRQKPVIVQTVGEAPSGYEPSQPNVTPNEVIVEGPESIVNTVASVIVNVNINDKIEDIKNRFPLKAIDSRGKEVNGVQIRQSLVEVTLPMYKVKEVPIVVEIEGEPKENYKVTNTSSNVGLVLIKGPSNIVDQISELKTEAINVDGLDNTTTLDIILQLPMGIETPYLSKVPNATLTVEEIVRKEFVYFKEEIGLGQLDKNYIIDISGVPDTINVEVIAVESVMKNLKKDDIQLYLNLNGLLEGKYSANILANLPITPDKITLTPSKVDFEIKLDKEPQPTTDDNEN